MHMPSVGKNIRCGGSLAMMLVVPCFVQVAEKHLDGVAFRPCVDMARGELPYKVSFIGVRGFAYLELLKLLLGLISELTALVLGALFGFTFFIQLPVDGIFFPRYFDKAFAQLPAQGFKSGVMWTLDSLFPLAGGIQAGKAPD